MIIKLLCQTIDKNNGIRSQPFVLEVKNITSMLDAIVDEDESDLANFGWLIIAEFHDDEQDMMISQAPVMAYETFKKSVTNLERKQENG